MKILAKWRTVRRYEMQITSRRAIIYTSVGTKRESKLNNKRGSVPRRLRSLDRLKIGPTNVYYRRFSCLTTGC